MWAWRVAVYGWTGFVGPRWISNECRSFHFPCYERAGYYASWNLRRHFTHERRPLLYDAKVPLVRDGDGQYEAVHQVRPEVELPHSIQQREANLPFRSKGGGGGGGVIL